jgi:hypothetical protein
MITVNPTNIHFSAPRSNRYLQEFSGWAGHHLRGGYGAQGFAYRNAKVVGGYV